MDGNLILIVVAGVLAVVELFRKQGQSLLGWAILALVAAALL